MKCSQITYQESYTICLNMQGPPIRVAEAHFYYQIRGHQTSHRDVLDCVINTHWILIKYNYNTNTIQIQCKYNILCCKMYCNRTWTALTLATALTLSTSEKIRRTESFCLQQMFTSTSCNIKRVSLAYVMCHITQELQTCIDIYIHYVPTWKH